MIQLGESYVSLKMYSLRIIIVIIGLAAAGSAAMAAINHSLV